MTGFELAGIVIALAATGIVTYILVKHPVLSVDTKIDNTKKETAKPRKVEHRDIQVDVGYADIEITFDDGRIIIKRIYGTYYTFVRTEYEIIHTQIDKAIDNNYLLNNSVEYSTHYDDERTPTVSYSGRVVQQRIIGSGSYITTEREPYFVDTE